jgi:hypothetical protein
LYFRKQNWTAKNLKSMLTGEARLIRVEIAQYVNKVTLKGKATSRRVWDWLGPSDR